MKECKKCGIVKEVTEFRLQEGKWHQGTCKACNREYAKERRKRPEVAEKHRAHSLDYAGRNREKVRARSLAYYYNNKERISEERKKVRKENEEYLKAERRKPENRKKAAEYAKKWRNSSVQARLSVNLRARLYEAFKTNSKAGSAVQDLGCTIDELKAYLEQKFLPEMTWDNYGFWGWHIDHIRPLSSFDLSNREEFLQACHYSNLQPLWATDNLRKNDNYEHVS